MSRGRETSVWLRPDPGTRQPRLSRVKIAQTAVALADAEGFDAVSMRRVAETLGMGTMSLYYYVKTKDELVALMDDALMGEHLLPKSHRPKRGKRALLDLALRTHALLVRHPWAITAMRGATPGPNALRHVEECLDVLADSKLSAKQKLLLLALVDDFVFGHALRASEERADYDPALAEAMLATGELPQLAATFAHAQPSDPFPPRLTRGIEAIIDSVWK